MEPLEHLIKKTCYANKRTRIAYTLGRKFLTRSKTVLIRYLYKIHDSRHWVSKIDDRQYRFEHQLDGTGIKDLWKRKDVRPEEILWKHLKFIGDHMDKLVDLESTKKWMVFDETCRVRQLDPIHDSVITNHAKRFDEGYPEYIGPRSSQKGGGLEYYSGESSAGDAASSGDEERSKRKRVKVGE